MQLLDGIIIGIFACPIYIYGYFKNNLDDRNNYYEGVTVTIISFGTFILFSSTFRK